MGGGAMASEVSISREQVMGGGAMASEVSSWSTTNQGSEEETPLELPQGFRFHPTDEELISHYLSNRSFSGAVIADVDLDKIEPWNLPVKWKMVDQEWYFFSFQDRKYATGMRTNRATASGYWKARGKDKEIVRSNHAPDGSKTTWVDGSAPIEHETGVDVAAGDMAMRFSTFGVLRNNIPLATRLNIAIGCAQALADINSSWNPYSILHGDLKPANILLDTENQLCNFELPGLHHAVTTNNRTFDDNFSRLSNFENQLSNFELSRLYSAVPTQNRQLRIAWDNFSAKPSPEGGNEIKTGSHMTHQRRYLSVHHHPLIQMLPSVRKWSGDIFTSCARLITSNRIFGTSDFGLSRLHHAVPTHNRSLDAKFSGKPSAKRGIEIKISSLMTHLRRYFSDPDSCRSGNSKRAVNTKTSDSWIVATGAPHHATGNRNLLSGFVMEHDDEFVHAVNRVPMKVLARGAVVTDALILPDVWFVPGLKENLVSVSQLAELDHSIGFGRGECCIRSARDAKIVGKGRLQKGGHYVLDYLKVPLAI